MHKKIFFPIMTGGEKSFLKEVCEKLHMLKNNHLSVRKKMKYFILLSFSPKKEQQFRFHTLLGIMAELK